MSRTPPTVEATADRVVRAFSEPFVLASGAVLTTVTVGVATTEDSADTDELLRHADLALYAAKAAGKRQWRRYQPVLSAGLVRRRELQAALEEAVAHSAFTLAYQPIVALDHRRARRVRGPGPVAASAVGNDAARPVHRPGRRDRPDRPARLLGTGQAAADMARWRRTCGQAPLDPARVPARRRPLAGSTSA